MSVPQSVPLFVTQKLNFWEIGYLGTWKFGIRYTSTLPERLVFHYMGILKNLVSLFSFCFHKQIIRFFGSTKIRIATKFLCQPPLHFRDACQLAYLPTSLLTCLFANLLPCQFACLPAYLLACQFGCLSTCLLANMLTCQLACLVSCVLACLPTCLLSYLLACLLAFLPICLPSYLLFLPTCLLTYLLANMLAYLLACLPTNTVG